MLFTNPNSAPGEYFIRFYFIDPDGEGPDDFEDEELSGHDAYDQPIKISEYEAIIRARALEAERTKTYSRPVNPVADDNRTHDSWEVVRRKGLHYDRPYWEYEHEVVHESYQEIAAEDLVVGRPVLYWQDSAWHSGTITRRTPRAVTVVFGDASDADEHILNMKAALALLRTR